MKEIGLIFAKIGAAFAVIGGLLAIYGGYLQNAHDQRNPDPLSLFFIGAGAYFIGKGLAIAGIAMLVYSRESGGGPQKLDGPPKGGRA